MANIPQIIAIQRYTFLGKPIRFVQIQRYTFLYIKVYTKREKFILNLTNIYTQDAFFLLCITGA